MLVEKVLSQASTAAFELGDVVAQFFDRLGLLGQEVGLDEIAHLGVIVFAGRGVQIEEALVHVLLQLQGLLQGVHTGTPVIAGRRNDVAHFDAAATLVLEFDELLGVFTFLVRVLLEELVEPGQGNVMTLEVGGHRQVDVAGVQFHVDLLVDAILALLMVVLTDDVDGHFARFA